MKKLIALCLLLASFTLFADPWPPQYITATTGTFTAPLTGTTGAFSGTVKLSNGYTVATLPAGTVGMRAYVTDATLPTYLGALTGGGTVTCAVLFNGTAWVSD